MLKKLHRMKGLEELLGVAGLVYLAVLCTVSVLLVQFLVGQLLQSYHAQQPQQSLLPSFDLEGARTALKDFGE